MLLILFSKIYVTEKGLIRFVQNLWGGHAGKPVIRGTRIPVEIPWRKLAEGATAADLLGAYPRVVVQIFSHLTVAQNFAV